MLALLLVLQAGDGPVYNGRARQLDVRIPRIEAQITVDGVLDERVWRQAATLTGFSQYRPVDGRPAEDSTEVLVWYAPDAVYFGIRAFEPHGHVVRATLADRDNIDADDRIEILLDAYLDHRRATLFAVHPLGAQSGRLVGLTGLKRGVVLDFTPEFTTKVDGAPGAGGYDYTGTPELGGNLRWGVTQNLAVTATANPDFSQVEADVGQVTVNERFALFYPEKRPFFLEGLEQFDTPNSLIYTRRIVHPVFGAKLAGKVGGTGIAYLGAVDNQDPSAAGSNPVYNLVRLRRDLGPTSTVGLAYTDWIDGDDYNRVLGADARVVWRSIWFSEVQVGG